MGQKRWNIINNRQKIFIRISLKCILCTADEEIKVEKGGVHGINSSVNIRITNACGEYYNMMIKTIDLCFLIELIAFCEISPWKMSYCVR